MSDLKFEFDDHWISLSCPCCGRIIYEKSTGLFKDEVDMSTPIRKLMKMLEDEAYEKLPEKIGLREHQLLDDVCVCNRFHDMVHENKNWYGDYPNWNVIGDAVRVMIVALDHEYFRELKLSAPLDLFDVDYMIRYMYTVLRQIGEYEIGYKGRPEIYARGEKVKEYYDFIRLVIKEYRDIPRPSIDDDTGAGVMESMVYHVAKKWNETRSKEISFEDAQKIVDSHSYTELYESSWFDEYFLIGNRMTPMEHVEYFLKKLNAQREDGHE